MARLCLIATTSLSCLVYIIFNVAFHPTYYFVDAIKIVVGLALMTPYTIFRHFISENCLTFEGLKSYALVNE